MPITCLLRGSQLWGTTVKLLISAFILALGLIAGTASAHATTIFTIEAVLDEINGSDVASLPLSGSNLALSFEVDENAPTMFRTVSVFSGGMGPDFDLAKRLDGLFWADEGSQTINFQGPMTATYPGGSANVTARIALRFPVNSFLSNSGNGFAIPDLVSLLPFATTQPMLRLDFPNGGNLLFVIYDVTVATTPIPAALPLFASALGGIGFIGWKRRKNLAT